MKILIVYAHPKGEGSLNAALKHSFVHGAKKNNEIKTLDLYRDGFNPVLSPAELKGEMSDYIKKSQDLIKWADRIVFFYPIWWFRTPSILEGWFDKVLTKDFAFVYKQITKTFGIPIGLINKETMVFETYGAPKWGLKLLYMDLPWRRIKRGIFNFCGFKIVKRYSCFSTPYASEKQREAWLKDAEKMGASLK